MTHSQRIVYSLPLLVIGLAIDSEVHAGVWVSSNGQASWQNARSSLPLNGAACCSLAVANANASPGDTVYLREGTYINQKIQPAKSGTSETNRIVFTNYNSEKALIHESSDGIYIYKKSYITVNGIDFDSLRRFVRIYAGNYNTVSFCNFDHCYPAGSEWVGALIANDPNDATAASEGSTHNRVDHCSFYRWVYGAYAEHRGALLDIGSSDTGFEDKSHYNLVENSTFAYGGHHTVAVYSKFNVIRNNYFHNETNPANWAYEGFRATLTEGPYAGSTLYERNKFGFAGASGVALRSQNNIFRFNTFYRDGNGAIQVVSNVAGVDHADYNHIYNNSFYHNGYQVDYVNFQGGIYFSSWSGVSPVGNVIKNNIFYDNKSGSIRYDGQVDPQAIERNWDQNSVDPGFVHSSGSDPDDSDLPDLHLRSNSAAIDSGTYLTAITSSSGSGAQFQVGDAKYFMDGWGIAGVAGDEIQLFGTAQRARVTFVNYATNVMTVDRSLTWTQNQGVTLAYEGLAPDIGAYEYGAGSAVASPVRDHQAPPCATVRLRGPSITVTLPASARLPVLTLVDLSGHVVFRATLGAVSGMEGTDAVYRCRLDSRLPRGMHVAILNGTLPGGEMAPARNVLVVDK